MGTYPKEVLNVPVVLTRQVFALQQVPYGVKSLLCLLNNYKKNTTKKPNRCGKEARMCSNETQEELIGICVRPSIKHKLKKPQKIDHVQSMSTKVKLSR
jgi:hypothetical protein